MLHVNILNPDEDHCIDGLEVSPNTTVDALRSVVARRFGVAADPAVVRLLTAGRLMVNGQPLSAYNIRDGASVHAVVRASAAPSPYPAAGSYPTQAQQQQHQHQSATAEAPGGGGVSTNMGTGGFDASQLVRALPGIIGGLNAASTFYEGCVERVGSAAERSATVADTMNLFSTLFNAASQQSDDRSQAAPPAAAPSAKASAGGDFNATSALNSAAFTGGLGGLAMRAFQQQHQQPQQNAGGPQHAASNGVPSAAGGGGVDIGSVLSNPAVANVLSAVAGAVAARAAPTLVAAAAAAPSGSNPSNSTVANPNGNQGGVNVLFQSASATSSASQPQSALEFTAPPPAFGCVPLAGPFFVEHIEAEVRRSRVDLNMVGMGFIMHNPVSLQPLRPAFAAAWRTFAQAQAHLVFPPAYAFAGRRVIALAGSEGERAYSALIREPAMQTFLRDAGVVSMSQLQQLHGEIRKFLKSAYLRLMRLSAAPAHVMNDTQWATALRSYIVRHAGLVIERAPQWFPVGGSNAAVQLVAQKLTDAVASGPEGQMRAGMVQAMAPQLTRAWHQEYLRRFADGGSDLECLWDYPTGGDVAVEDDAMMMEVEGRRASGAAADDDLDHFVNEVMAAEAATAASGGVGAPLPPTSTSPSATATSFSELREGLNSAVAEWTRAAGLRQTVAERLAAITAASEAAASTACSESGDGSCAASPLWTELSQSRRQ